MKKLILEGLKRGLMAASGGPVILSIIYGTLGAKGIVQSLTPQEVSVGIVTIALMAFIAAGISVIYQVERLPLLAASLIHAAALYADYLLIYLLNDWLTSDLVSIGIFTAIFVGGYLLIWLCIWLSIRAKTRKLNGLLGEK